MTKQTTNLISVMMHNDEATIRKALNMVSAKVRNEIAEHYGGSLETAITHIHLGTK